MKSLRSPNIVFILFIIIVLYSCSDQGKSEANAMKQAPLAIDAVVASTKKAVNTVNVSGVVKAAEQTVIASEIAGKIVSISFKEGSLVSKGDVLIRLDDRDLNAQKTRVEAQLRLAQQTADRLASLQKVEGVSRQELEQSLAQIDILKAELAIIDANLSKTVIRAPFSGTIGLRNVSEGAVVAASQGLCSLRSNALYKVEFDVAEKYAALVKTGMEISFSNQGDTLIRKAKVIATESAIDEGTRALRVQAQVEKNDGVLPGAFVEVQATLGGERESIFIPTQCIIPQGRSKFAVAVKSGVAQFIEVQTGQRMSNDVEILTGLNVSDTIATTGILFLKPGAPVRVAKIVSEP
jgi:membrane fusion protein (multidrug efflux system)